MPRTLVKSSLMVTMSGASDPIPRGAAIVDDGRITRIGLLEQLANEGTFDREVGSESRHIALPGFVNAHHHPALPSGLGLTLGPLLGPLEIRLLRRQERRRAPITDEEAYLHTLWKDIQMIKSGVTAVVEMHGSLERIDDMYIGAAVKGHSDSGQRVLLCIGCSDQNRLVYGDDRAFVESLPAPARDRLRPVLRPFDAEAYFAGCDRLFKAHHGTAGRIHIGFGPGGVQWCSEGLFQRLRDAARDYGTNIQTHLVETKYQMHYFRRRGTTAVGYLNRTGVLGPNLSCAHGVWLTQEDCKVLAQSGTTVVHNPSSNLALASGIAPIADLLAAGANVGFGMDILDFNDSDDILSDLRLGWLLQRRPGIDTPRPSPRQMLAMATVAGAKALPGGGHIGSLQEGKRADIVLLDRERLFSSPYLSPSTPIEDVILRRAVGQDVDTVMIDGKVVMEGRRLLAVDEASVERQVRASMEPFLSLTEGDTAFMRELAGYAGDFYRRLEEEAGPVPTNYQYNTR